MKTENFKIMKRLVRLFFALCALNILLPALKYILNENIQFSNEVSFASTEDEEYTHLDHIQSLMQVLLSIRQGKFDTVSGSDINNGIIFLKLLLNTYENTTIPSTDNNNKRYDRKEEEWDTDKPDCNENFYPGANYTGEVCSEILMRTDDRYPNWPYFKLKDSCAKKSASSIARLVTIVLNVATYCKVQLKSVSRTIESIQQYYPKIQIKIAVPGEFAIPKTSNVFVNTINGSDEPGDIWNNLIKKVDTPYVLLGKDLVGFDDEVQLERLVREIPSLKVPIIAGAVKTSSNGHWTNGCQQVTYKNFTLVYRNGYRHSRHDCLFCNSVLGPIIGRTHFFKSNPLNKNLSENVLFYDYFFDLYKKGQSVVSCPDVMFLVREEAVAALKRSDLLPLVKSHPLNKVITAEGKSFVYTCKETGGDQTPKRGLAIPPCKLQNLADHIKFVMRVCREYNIICELNAGTTVGALKMNTVLPWERDADILYYHKNASKMQELGPVFRKSGYTLKAIGLSNYIKSTVYASSGSGWNIDLYPNPTLSSVDLRSKGEQPTVLLLDGDWVEVPKNVGKDIRNRYGPEIYKHVEHSTVIPQDQFSVKVGYKRVGQFTKCPTPGAHDCLDQFNGDGNLQFVEWTP